jgi:hypothetical protein
MSRHDKLLLRGILVISVLLRVGVALYLGNVVDAPPLMTDQRSYHALGVRLLGGHGFSFDIGWYPFTPADTPTAHWSFLYSLVVAGIYAIFGVQPLAVRLVQAIVGGVLLPLGVYKLARRIFGADHAAEARSRKWDPLPSSAPPTAAAPLAAATPLAAAAVAAVYGYFVLYAATMMTETLFIIVVLWSLTTALGIARCLAQQQNPPLSLVLQLGLSLSLGTLLRQSILPWVPVLLAYLVWRGWRAGRTMNAARTVLLVGAMLIASILPWTYRNYRAYGQFLLLNSNSGFAMYSAQHPMHGTRFREFEAAPVPQDWDRGNEAALDQQLMRLGIQFVLEDPGRYLLLSLSRLRAFVKFWPSPNTTLLHNIGRVGSFGLFLPLMLHGLYKVLRRPDLAQGSDLLFLFVVFYTLLHVLTWAMVRYRLPVDAALMPWAGLAVADLGRRTMGTVRSVWLRTETDRPRVAASMNQPPDTRQHCATGERDYGTRRLP